MATRPKSVIESHDGEKLSPITITKNVLTDNGQNLHDILSDRKEDMMTPTIENSNSMFKVGQGDNVDYSNNVVNGAYESCVLKGKSLVNIHKRQGYTLEQSVETQEASKYENIIAGDNHISFDMVDGGSYGWGSYVTCGKVNLDMLKPNTKYLVYFGTAITPSKYSVAFRDKDSSNLLGTHNNVPKGQNYAVITTVNEIIKSNQYLYISYFQGDTGHYEFKDVVVTEYQEGMENLDIPYFEGICDVKSPILSNVGKNLFNIDGEFIKSGYSNGIPIISHPSSQQTIEKIGDNTFRVITSPNSYNTGYGQFINVRGLDHITLSCSSIFSNSNTFTEIKVLCMYQGEELLTTVNYETSKNYINRVNTLSLSTPNQEYSTNIYVAPYDRIFVSFTGNWKSEMSGTFEFTMNDVYIRELLDNNEDYEPYKSNTTTFEQKDGKTIVLHSLPSGVCDTLNVETGEYTQRIGEYTYNGDNDVKQHYVSNNNHGQPFFTIEVSSLGRKESTNGISDTLPHESIYSAVKQTKNAFCVNLGGNTAIRFYIDGLTTTEQYQNHFRNAPITIQYELATPIVSTIDVQGFPYAYINGHVQLSSGSIEQSLTPTVEYSVITNRNGQIRSNQKMVERQQKELDRLQAMVLANLVNTQYEQTLTNLKYDLKNVREEVK